MMETQIAETSSDWLLEDYTSNQAKDAVVLSMNALIQIAKQCCYPPLALDEMKDLLEVVWYEMVPEEIL